MTNPSSQPIAEPLWTDVPSTPMVRHGWDNDGDVRAFRVIAAKDRLVLQRVGAGGLGCGAFFFGCILWIIALSVLGDRTGKNGISRVEQFLFHGASSFVVAGLGGLASGLLVAKLHRMFATRVVFDRRADLVSVRFGRRSTRFPLHEFVAVQICQAPGILELNLVQRGAGQPVLRHPILTDIRHQFLADAAQGVVEQFPVALIDDSGEKRHIRHSTLTV